MKTEKRLKDDFLPEIETAYLYIIDFLNNKDKIEFTDNLLMRMTKNLIESTRTIQVLSKLNREESITILTRAFLELNVSLRFILKEDTEKRSLSYFYNQKIQTIEKLIKMKSINPIFSLQLNKQELKALQTEVPEATSLEDYVSYYDKKWSLLFLPNKGKKKKKKWYALNWEYQTFKDLMQAIDINPEMYYFFYGIASLDVHGMGAGDNMRINNSDFKMSGILPTNLCFSLIESYLSTVIYELSIYYGLTNDPKQIENFRKIANSCSFIH